MKSGKGFTILVLTLLLRNLSVSISLLMGVVLISGCVVTEKGVAERREGSNEIDVSSVC